MKNNKYKVLIVAPAWVGDVVMSQTLFKVLKDQYQERLELDVLANKIMLPLLSRMPEVNEVILSPFRHGKLDLIQRAKIGWQLRSKRYDQVFILPNSLKSAITPFFAGIKIRTGFLGESRYILVNDYYKLNPLELPLMVERFCALANSGKLYQQISYPKLMIDIDNQKLLCQKFKLDEIKPTIAFCPGAEYGPAKRWSTEYFAALANLLSKDGYQVVLLGSANDVAISSKIVDQVTDKGQVIDLCGKTNLSDVVDLLALAKYVITNDSGLMHIAAAVGSKVVAIYGSTSPKFTPPLTSTAKILSVKLDCSPCFQRTCRFGHYNCLRFIPPEKVYASLDGF